MKVQEKLNSNNEIAGYLIAINAQVRDNGFNKKNRKVAVAVATTIAEVEAI